MDRTPTPGAIRVGLIATLAGAGCMAAAGIGALLALPAGASGALALSGGVLMLVVPTVAGLRRR